MKTRNKPSQKSPIKLIRIKMRTLEAVLKGEGSFTGCSAVVDLLHEALEKDRPMIVIEDEITGREYRLTKKGLVELRPQKRRGIK